jgi:hypothetical protein
MKILRSLVIVTALLALSATAATAQPRAKTGTDETGAPFSNKYYREMPADVAVSLLSRPELPAGSFVVRLAVTDVVNSCARLTPLTYDLGYDNMYLDVTLNDYRVDLRDAPKAPQYECKVGNQFPVTDVPLNVNDLRARGITKIRFHYFVLIDTYDLELKDNYVRLTPAKQNNKVRANRFGGSKAYGVQSPLELWLLPKDTIVLYAPSEPDGKGLPDEINNLATGRGLLPLSTRLPGFVPPVTTPHQYYYVDPQNAYIKDLDGDQPQLFSTLRHMEKEYGLKGDEYSWHDIEIYMKKPGLYE